MISFSYEAEEPQDREIKEKFIRKTYSEIEKNNPDEPIEFIWSDNKYKIVTSLGLGLFLNAEDSDKI